MKPTTASLVLWLIGAAALGAAPPPSPVGRPELRNELPLFPNRSRKKYSLASFLLSPLTSTVMVFVVSPGWKVSVPIDGSITIDAQLFLSSYSNNSP